MNDLKRVEEIVGKVIRKRLSDTRIVSINVRLGRDHLGERIYRISVVFDSPKNRLDSDKTLGLVRLIRAELREGEDAPFPIISFIAKSDLGKLSPEAA